MAVVRVSTVTFIRQELDKVGVDAGIPDDFIEQLIGRYTEKSSTLTFEMVNPKRFRYNHGGFPFYIYVGATAADDGITFAETATGYKLYTDAQLLVTGGSDVRSSFQVAASQIDLPEIMTELFVMAAGHLRQKVDTTGTFGNSEVNYQVAANACLDQAGIWRGVKGC